MGVDLPLIARGAELAVLVEAIVAVADGHGETVMLCGEAGIGKRYDLKLWMRVGAHGIPSCSGLCEVSRVG
jgi:hypothetical protein